MKVLKPLYWLIENYKKVAMPSEIGEIKVFRVRITDDAAKYWATNLNRTSEAEREVLHSWRGALKCIIAV